MLLDSSVKEEFVYAAAVLAEPPMTEPMGPILSQTEGASLHAQGCEGCVTFRSQGISKEEALGIARRIAPMRAALLVRERGDSVSIRTF